MQTENKDEVLCSLMGLGFDSPLVKMTDGSLSHARDSEVLGLSHLRCMKQFKTFVDSAERHLL
eukprot:snap_masked-scaffold_21-processed-gene-3.15-mRNA-1 protein AED:1.00 eAED:1.00 QI:0/-1/0/0/-1/1/1/0/62